MPNSQANDNSHETDDSRTMNLTDLQEHSAATTGLAPEGELDLDAASVAVAEIRASASALDAALSDGETTGGTEGSARRQAPETRDAEYYRTQAAKQRKKGQENLTKRHDGIASQIVTIQLNERVIGSSFERFFAPVEDAIYQIVRRGPSVLGIAESKLVIDSLTTLMLEVEKTVNADAEGINLQLADLSQREDFIKPGYTKAAADHQVQIRHRLALKLARLYEKQDGVIVGLQTLVWNFEIDESEIHAQEYKYKKAMSGIHSFVRRVVTGMAKRTSAPNPSTRKPGTAALLSAPPEANDAAVEEAAA